MSPFHQETFSSAQDFVDALHLSNSRWGGEDAIECDWIFRGQADATWKLLPSLFRPDRKHQVVDRFFKGLKASNPGMDWPRWAAPGWLPSIKEDDPRSRERFEELAVLMLAELLAIRWFADLGDNIGHPMSCPAWLSQVDDPNRCQLSEYFTGHREPDLVFAMAQHHGIPTRLLDWTQKPLVAAFFAAEGVVRGGANPGQEIAVWALKGTVLRHEQHLKRFSVPYHRLPFLQAQEGLFVWAPAANSIYLARGEFPHVEELVEATTRLQPALLKDGPVLRRFVLPATQSEPLLKLLWRERVSRAHLMPTFDNVAATIALVSNWI